jgi:hypothetical protein
MQAVIDKSFPWLRTGRPVSDNYAKFEKWHIENIQAQLTLEAARLTRESQRRVFIQERYPTARSRT